MDAAPDLERGEPIAGQPIHLLHQSAPAEVFAQHLAVAEALPDEQPRPISMRLASIQEWATSSFKVKRSVAPPKDDDSPPCFLTLECSKGRPLSDA